MKSIEYYNTHSNRFINDTVQADMTALYKKFESYVNSGHILDLGCGSGRDSFYFSYKYKVTSVDGSKKMIEYCESVLSNPVVHSTFEDYETQERYNGIWACASLIHVERNNLLEIIEKYLSYLKDDGIFMMSFKDRTEDFNEDGRYFTCFTRESLSDFLSKSSQLNILEIIENVDVRENKNENWISVIINKAS
ncbi:class I SAM-dependent methyltransferase [Acidaminobacter sp. JC074]|uniref:class I SAM-dependent methyltransferase n=1 Tax=Acidaminobacter sp. JC074 TaxID=2530199 RepID=UPI001F106A38|nr:class I SAM-dependent methyltransferase [Acidaminobacter sp. JC074]MCH4886521.1 class I SAM-dependent methyltransferase [Acidaminobacter sp. JC074]